jgi:hypothetical protein
MEVDLCKSLQEDGILAHSIQRLCSLLDEVILKKKKKKKAVPVHNKGIRGVEVWLHLFD